MQIDSFDLHDEMPPQVIEWWRGVVSACPEPPTGSDMTTSPEWHGALAHAFMRGQRARVLVAHGADGAILAALPVFRRLSKGGSRFGDVLALPTEAYGGRAAILAEPDAGDAPERLLRQLDLEYPDWSRLEMTVTSGNQRSANFIAAARACIGAIESEVLPASPYVVLPDSFDAYFMTLRPSFRTEVRRGERRLREVGKLTRRLFSTTEDLEPLWDAICSIERASWKEAAGTSITANPAQEHFYREFLPRGAAAGQLLAAVLYLDDRPIAHKLCLYEGGVAAILKMSYVEDLKRYYPSTVLLAGYLAELIARGSRYLDFMGVCDDFKMRWTNLTYNRTRYVLFRRSVRGRLDLVRYRAARRVAALRSPAHIKSAATNNA